MANPNIPKNYNDDYDGYGNGRNQDDYNVTGNHAGGEKTLHQKNEEGQKYPNFDPVAAELNRLADQNARREKESSRLKNVDPNIHDAAISEDKSAQESESN